MSQSIFSNRFARIAALVVLFGAAFGIRMYDLTDLPLDFHPTRQLLSAIRARGLFYETQPDGYPTWKLEAGIQHMRSKADIEPVVYERLVAFTYRFTDEHVWIARIYSSVFWMIGAVFLFLLVRDLVSFEGALVAAAYYLLFPYAVIASRSFQPDIPMIALTISFWWMLFRWMRSPSWMNSVLSGLLGGFAIFIKFPAAFFVIGGALGLLLSRFSFRELLRNARVWLIAVLGALPPLAYVIYGVFDGRLATEFGGNFIPALMFSPLNYLNWLTKADTAAGGIFIMLGLLGFFLVKNERLRALMFGLWGGYLLFGSYFNYHAGTHDYYHMPLIPIVALSLAPLGELVLARLAESASSPWVRSGMYVILLLGMFSVVWSVRNQMKAVDYRPEAAMWAEIGEKLNHETTAVALTEDYGSRLQYFGWTSAAYWPASGDLYAASLRGNNFDFEKEFSRRIQSKAYFLVTDFNDLKAQPELQARLATYPIFAQGEGYVIYDLENR
ncbi:MAG: glycosyltransferase family 39 protein [Anaerolineae bacterium]|nr:glycosyltransferase family 39 protein [Anaerolineae bacterium]